jgi:Transposase domain (DUF772)
LRLAGKIDWNFLAGRFSSVCRVGPGQPPLPTRLVAGLLILKHMHNLSDEALCERWVENPYFQYLCGEVVFRHELPFDRSSLTRWRQRLGAKAFRWPTAPRRSRPKISNCWSWQRSSALAERSEPAWSFRIKSERALRELPEFVLSSEILHGSGSASREAPARQGTKGERLGARSRCGLAEDAFTFWEARDRVGDGSPCGLPASAFA